MFNNLLQALGQAAGTVYNIRAAFGAFKLKREVTVGVHDGASKTTRSYIAEDNYTAVGLVEVQLGEPVDDPRGMNKHLVGEDGFITPELFSAKIAASASVNKGTQTMIINYPEEFMRADSQVALLVALLSTYYVVLSSELGVKPSLQEYDDGHLRVDIMNEIAGTPSAAHWYKERMAVGRGWAMGNVDDSAKFPVLYCAGLNGRDVAVILMHLAGRNRTTQYAFDLDIPTLAEQVLVSGFSMPTRGLPKVTDITASEMKGIINMYVASNRLFAAFEVALALYQQIAITPLPDHAEGYAWLVRKRVLTLPAFDSFRGAYRILTQQEPANISTVMSNTYEYWRNHGLACAVQGGMYNAFSLWGRYLAEGGYYKPEAGILNRLGDDRVSEAPGAAYYAYASMIVGGEVYCPVPRSYGITYMPWREDAAARFPVTVLDADARGYNIVSTGGVDTLMVREIPTPCSAIHVLTRLDADGPFSCLSDRFQVKIRAAKGGWVLSSVNEAWGFAMVTRWLGYDVDMQYRGLMRHGNWAPNSSSIAARPFMVDGPDIETVRVENITERKRVHKLLPYLGNDLATWQVDVAVSDKCSMSSAAGYRLGATSSYIPRARNGKGIGVVKIKTGAEVAYSAIGIRTMRRTDLGEAYFQVAGPDIPAVPPEPTTELAAAEEAADLEAEGLPPEV
jgi:hypothetical protein